MKNYKFLDDKKSLEKINSSCMGNLFNLSSYRALNTIYFNCNIRSRHWSGIDYWLDDLMMKIIHSEWFRNKHGQDNFRN
jgi:hypothetical protein